MPGFSVPYRHILATMLVVMGCLPAVAQVSGSAARPKPRITSEIDESQRTTLHDGLHSQLTKDRDNGEAASDLALSKVVLLLKRAPEVQSSLDQLTKDQQDPHSASYRQWLTPEQMGTRFGVASEDLNQVTNWLQTHGFRVDTVAHSGQLIQFSGTHAQLQEAFHTSLHIFKDASGTNHYANVSEPSIPSALAPVVSGIASLNNYPLKAMHRIAGAAHRNGITGDWTVRPYAGRTLSGAQTNVAKPSFSTTIGTSKFQAVGPYDFATIYNVLPLWSEGIDGTGQTVAVLAESDINSKDVDAFRSAFGLPAKPIKLIYVGTNPGINSTYEEEADLDAQWSGAVAKNADIDVVIAGDTATTSGLVLGAYEVIDNNLASVLSVSFGECELGLGNSGNQLYSALWQQAAAEGITVAISSGDSGSAGCDQGSGNTAQYGLTVNGLASTPYNVAVGGTDLYGTYTARSTYWSTTNNATTLQSALNYVPELPWNDTCGSPQYLAALHGKGKVPGDTTNEALCNDTSYSSTIYEVGAAGGGGLSNCVDSVYHSATWFSCYSGYTKPWWQTGVLGIPAENNRSLPDISLFAGDGLWGSAYIFCSSDNSPDGVCDYTSSTDLEYLAAGGTSFSSPAFAGIMALVNQKLSGRQGNAAPALYRLAAEQFATAAPANCDATVAVTGSTCLFQDVSTGNNAQPCAGGSRDCDPTGYYDMYGVLPGYSANAGYDSAVGLGSLNVANLVNAWGSISSTYAASNTSLTLAQSTAVYGNAATGTVTVTAATGTTVPTGDISALATGYGNGPYTLANGQASVSILGLSPGAHSMTAHYEGDATFGASDSKAANLTITQATTTLTLQPSKTVLADSDTITLSTTVATSSTASSPTGTVTFTDNTTGTTLGSATLQSSTDTSGHSIAIGGLNISGHLLGSGKNSIVASYAGDSNYTKSTSAAVVVSYTSSFALTAAQSALTLLANGSGSLTVTVRANSGTLAQEVFLSCPQTLPKGLSCAFSPAILPAGVASAQSTLTVYASSALAKAQPLPLHGVPSRRWPLTGAPVAVLVVFLLPLKKRRMATLLSVLLMGSWMVALWGCSSSTASPKATKTTLSTSAASVTTGSAVTFTSAVTDYSGAPVVNGSVTFNENGVTLSSSKLNASGIATFTTSSLATGSHTLTATSSSTATGESSTSASVTTDVTYSLDIKLTATDSAGNNSSITMPTTVK